MVIKFDNKEKIQQVQKQFFLKTHMNKFVCCASSSHTNFIVSFDESVQVQMSGVLMNETVYDSSIDWWECPSEAPKSWQVAQRVTGIFIKCL